MSDVFPVITIDGPSGSGKGTIAQLLAQTLGWHFLDSGALYRAIAWGVMQEGIELTDEQRLVALIRSAKVEMPVAERGRPSEILYNNHNISVEIRAVACSQMASRVSAVPAVRAELLAFQRRMRQPPGLVTDGRDMGTVVFPDATVKFYFEAPASVRAERRYNQLKAKGKHVSLPHIEMELRARDERDLHRAVSPLKPASDAIIINTAVADIETVLQSVLEHVRSKLP